MPNYMTHNIVIIIGITIEIIIIIIMHQDYAGISGALDTYLYTVPGYAGH